MLRSSELDSEEVRTNSSVACLPLVHGRKSKTGNDLEQSTAVEQKAENRTLAGVLDESCAGVFDRP